MNYLLLILVLTLGIILYVVKAYKRQKYEKFRAQNEMRVREYIKKGAEPRRTPSREFRGTRVGMSFNDSKRS